MRLVGIFFNPPLAIARVGGSAVPLESYSWGTERTIHGAHQTVVRPEVTLKVRSDGSVLPYMPNAIEFRDGEELRPVAPFFELWVELQGVESSLRPLTLALMDDLGISIKSLAFSVTVANRKAQRRTGSAACAFIARVGVQGNDHARKPLLASSPHEADEAPLVAAERPVPLGWFQVIKPLPATLLGTDLSIVRVRFTPAAGEVYGPPTAISAPASPLPPGGALAASTLGGRLHELVPERNRILNPGTPWSTYEMDTETQEEPQPSDSYDGANVGHNRSWGVVDDTCDGVIHATVVAGGQRFTADARVVSGCPDYAPDKRPFFSLADDLADRDLPPVPIAEDVAQSEAEIADLFQRVFETVSLVNLDSTRIHGIGENVSDDPPVNPPGLPRIDDGTMTALDTPYVDLVPPLLERLSATTGAARPRERLVYSSAARAAHAPLTDIETLLFYLQTQRAHVERLLRPPYGRFKDYEPRPGPIPHPRHRDPRVRRDTMQDMRMPPYMRDSDQTPMSLTYRQYHAVLDFLELLQRPPTHPESQRPGMGPHSPLARRILAVAERVRASAVPREPSKP